MCGTPVFATELRPPERVDPLLSQNRVYTYFLLAQFFKPTQAEHNRETIKLNILRLQAIGAVTRPSGSERPKRNTRTRPPYRSLPLTYLVDATHAAVGRYRTPCYTYQVP